MAIRHPSASVVLDGRVGALASPLRRIHLWLVSEAYHTPEKALLLKEGKGTLKEHKGSIWNTTLIVMDGALLPSFHLLAPFFIDEAFELNYLCGRPAPPTLTRVVIAEIVVYIAIFDWNRLVINSAETIAARYIVS